jgi:hypothetical protein
MDFVNKQQKSTPYLDINPNGKIPTLVDHKNNDFAIWESNAILQYLVAEYDKEHKISVADDDKAGKYKTEQCESFLISSSWNFAWLIAVCVSRALLPGFRPRSLLWVRTFHVITIFQANNSSQTSPMVHAVPPRETSLCHQEVWVAVFVRAIFILNLDAGTRMRSGVSWACSTTS